MASVPSSTLIPVHTVQLQLGMHVAELDRSWLQTSFHSHGFVLTHPDQIKELQRVCDHVYVDPLLSEQSDDFFSTGLTGRMEVIGLTGPVTPLDRQRVELRTLAHAYSVAVQGARRSGDVVPGNLRRALSPVVASLETDADSIPWLLSTELKVGYLHRRALGTAVLMVLAGRQMGFRRPYLDDLALAGLLLDIGKISVPVTILAKSQPLSSHERGFIERHVRRGLYMLNGCSDVPEIVEEAILGHHERLDGSGYPLGVRGTRIPIAARLAAVADTYDAMLLDRRYAPAIAPHNAIRQVNSLCGRKFDAAIVKVFMRTLGLFPTASWLQVADGRVGLVRCQAQGEPARPHVALVCDSAGRKLPGGPTLWQPAGRGDVVRVLEPGNMRVPLRQLEESVAAAANLAA